MKPDDIERIWDEFNTAVRAGDDARARSIASTLRNSGSPHALLGASRAAQALGDYSDMLGCARQARRLAPDDPVVSMRWVESLIFSGDIGEARAELDQFAAAHVDDAPHLQQVAAFLQRCADHEAAHRLYERAAVLAPSDPGTLYNLATSCSFMGDGQRAALLYEKVIALDPGDFAVFQNRSGLRTATASENHVAELQKLLDRLPGDHSGRIPLSYALGKELEDLGDHDAAFAAYSGGAAQRRARMAYRVDSDEQAIAAIRQAYDENVLKNRARPEVGDPSLFVIGLPRSGTTLVDRILSSHPQVRSLGETPSLVFALMGHAGGVGGKLQAIQRATTIDPNRFGLDYRLSTRSLGRSADRLLNKTPTNYLYLGLIHQALPSGKVVHVRRNAMDSCFAMYKTLFLAGYPFSYSLSDLARYYVAYEGLMRHWRDRIQATFVEVDYERLVEQQEQTSRELVQYCDLPWDAAVLSFHTNKAPIATASASQVRRPIYNSSVNRWRLFERHLKPLAREFEAQGIDPY